MRIQPEAGKGPKNSAARAAQLNKQQPQVHSIDHLCCDHHQLLRGQKNTRDTIPCTKNTRDTIPCSAFLNPLDLLMEVLIWKAQRPPSLPSVLIRICFLRVILQLLTSPCSTDLVMSSSSPELGFVLQFELNLGSAEQYVPKPARMHILKHILNLLCLKSKGCAQSRLCLHFPEQDQRRSSRTTTTELC